MKSIAMPLLSFALIVVAACAPNQPLRRDQARFYTLEARTPMSETAVRSCAASQKDIGASNGTIGKGAGDLATTAYGPGTVSNSVSFKTRREGTETVLQVTATSWVHPNSGKGESNSNTVGIAPTPEAEALARSLAQRCANWAG